MKSTATPLHTKIDQMLTAARVILPGAQALLGFQLIVMMTPTFEELKQSTQMLHLIALACVLAAVLLLIAPAAVHRIAFGGRDDEQAYEADATLLTWALAPFAIGLCCDFYVALTRLLNSEWLVCALTAAMFIFLTTFWYRTARAQARASRALSRHSIMHLKQCARSRV